MIPDTDIPPLDDPDSVEATVHLRTRIEHSLEAPDDCSEFILDLNFGIFGAWFSDTEYLDQHEVSLGEIRLQLIRVSAALEDGIPLGELFDVSQSVYDLFAALFDGDFEYSPNILKQFDTANSCSDLFFLRHMILEPWARKQRLGLAIVRKLLLNWSSGCSLAVLKPHPLQSHPDCYDPDEWEYYQFDKLPQDLNASKKRLRSYFAQLGFKSVKDCPYMLLPLGLIGPEADDLDIPESVHIPPRIAKSVEQGLVT